MGTTLFPVVIRAGYHFPLDSSRRIATIKILPAKVEKNPLHIPQPPGNNALMEGNSG
jgi:hypothetical protein